jgi:hypothetical protein
LDGGKAILQILDEYSNVRLRRVCQSRRQDRSAGELTISTRSVCRTAERA